MKMDDSFSCYKEYHENCTGLGNRIAKWDDHLNAINLSPSPQLLDEIRDSHITITIQY